MGTHPTRVIDSHELIFVRSGVLNLFEEKARFEVRAGEALHLWPGRKHGGTAAYPANLSFYWVHFSVPNCGRKRARKGCISIAQHTKVKRPDRLTELFRLFMDDQESAHLRLNSASLLLTMILEEAANTGSGVRDVSGGTAALSARAEQYILTHFHEPISAFDVASAVSCNPDYLGRVFRKVRGVTVTEAINVQRLRQARKLLMDSVHNIDEVARSCGYKEAGYFRRVFRRIEGMTPVAFRCLYSRMHVNTE